MLFCYPLTVKCKATHIHDIKAQNTHMSVSTFIVLVLVVAVVWCGCGGPSLLQYRTIDYCIFHQLACFVDTMLRWFLQGL